VPQLYYGSPLNQDIFWWDDSNTHVYYVVSDRGYQGYSLVRVNGRTGAAKVLVHEEADTGIDPRMTRGGQPNIRVIAEGSEVVWFSQRDGWGHLYLYDAESGSIKNRITEGPWAVAEIEHIDEENRTVYFTAVGREQGRDPYYQHLYRTSLDGGSVELLTPEDAHHKVSFAPSGGYFVDTYSRLDMPPRSVLRTTAGECVLELEEADDTQLQAMGWTYPERFCVKGRDGQTDIYGIILRPSNFNEQDKLPVLDDIYAGPQTNRAHVSFGHSAEKRSAGFWQAQALAELGFVVVMIDGMGMPYRSKAFQDYAFRDLADGGVDDHIAALRQLADKYPYMDLERVGIYGHSAGGYSSAHAILAYPEFFEVAVSTAGNHDHRLDEAVWVERYMGLPVEDHYREQANSSIAHRLEGKLLLMHGEMDENVHPASTLQLVDALIKADKDFDMFILPNRPHACTGDPFFIRKRWEYFVRHLLGAEPPKDYHICTTPK